MGQAMADRHGEFDGGDVAADNRYAARVLCRQFRHTGPQRSKGLGRPDKQAVLPCARHRLLHTTAILGEACVDGQPVVGQFAPVVQQNGLGLRIQSRGMPLDPANPAVVDQGFQCNRAIFKRVLPCNQSGQQVRIQVPGVRSDQSDLNASHRAHGPLGQYIQVRLASTQKNQVPLASARWHGRREGGHARYCFTGTGGTLLACGGANVRVRSPR